jgi:hypothetical protein
MFRSIAATILLPPLASGVMVLRAADPPSATQVRTAAAQIHLLRPLRLADPVPVPPASAYAHAAAGEIVTGLAQGAPGEPHRAWAVAVLEAPADRLWAAVNDELGFARDAWEGEGAVVRGRACADGRASLVTMPVPLLPDRWWIVGYRWAADLERASGGAVRELSWREEADLPDLLSPALQRAVDDGARVGVSRGAWLLVALDEEHTLVEYQLQSDAGGGLPGVVAGPFCASAIRNTLRAMEARAATGTARCPVATTSSRREKP